MVNPVAGSIPISNYVDITSGVGGQNQVPTRNYGGLVITGNSLVPTGQILTFTSAAAVGTYFGTASEEYARAVFYFGWVSKNITSPAQLNFWFWNQDAATADLLYGGTPIDTLSAFNGFTSGELELTMGGHTHTLTGINLSAAGSLAAVATDIQTAIQAYSAGGSAWTGATVSYNSTTGTFNLTGGATGADTIGVQAAAANDLAGPLGWLASNAVLSNGTAAQTQVANLNQLQNLSNNFGSFCYTNALGLTLTQVEAAASWNLALNPNIQFLYSIPVSAANAATWSAALASTGGCTLTLAPLTTEYPEMVPMMIFAATNYNNVNSVQNYKYQQFALTPSVADEADYQTYTGLNVNFYGQTQTAGQLISFYQNGVMMGEGVTTNPQYQNLYANEIWFKDQLAAALMNLLLELTQIPANNAGAALILSQLQSIINQALLNGVIEVGKALNNTQILYITQITGSNTAWKQVQNQGYWVTVNITSAVVSGVTTYTANYTLIYAKDDVVQSITGSNVLI